MLYHLFWPDLDHLCITYTQNNKKKAYFPNPDNNYRLLNLCHTII